jgi:hypothetical protein
MFHSRLLEPTNTVTHVRRLRPVLAFALVLALGIPTAGPAPADAATPALRVTVYCYSNPERTVVENNRSYAITIARVGSIYQPRSGEPYAVWYRLGAGKTVTFYSGYGASAGHPRTLTRQYIFNNDVGALEGARVTRPNGVRHTDRCG